MPAVIDSDASIKSLVLSHYLLQEGEFISEANWSGNGIQVYSQVSSSPMWNHAAWLGESLEDLQAFTEGTCRFSNTKGRRPVVYVLASSLDQAETLLLEKGFERFDYESWMVHDGGSSEATDTHPLEIKKVATEGELDDFIDVFYPSYQVHERTYASSLKNHLREEDAQKKTHHFVAYSQGHPVCIATTIQSGGKGTLPF
jgi:hypothetical protein